MLLLAALHCKPQEMVSNLIYAALNCKPH